MDINFKCAGCGLNLCASPEQAGSDVACPDCGTIFSVPPRAAQTESVRPGNDRSPASQSPPKNETLTEEPRSEPDGHAVVCPVCWLESDRGELMHLAVHDSLRGDPILGEDAQQRFLATRFDNSGAHWMPWDCLVPKLPVQSAAANCLPVSWTCRITSFHSSAMLALGSPIF